MRSLLAAALVEGRPKHAWVACDDFGIVKINDYGIDKTTVELFFRKQPMISIAIIHTFFFSLNSIKENLRMRFSFTDC